MSPKTKTFALKKLEHMKIVIGTEKKILEDPPLEYSPTDYWENLKRVMYWRTDQKIRLEGKPHVDIPEMDYTQFPPKFVGKQSYIVNAMYTPSENSIYIPLAYLQKPFIDLDERGIEYNLANIGFTLCHEMSHALDDMGSMFDHTGNLFNWWTPQDKQIFQKKQANIILQYEYFAKRDGIIFDAGPSVGEDLADISGVAICQEYLRDFQDKNDDIAPIRKLSYLAFFVYFAYQQRQKISKKAINAQLHTNPHPLDQYRTNIPLSRLKLFKAIYQISKKDKMYWPTADTIW
jgi:putative endopeptidase